MHRPVSESRASFMPLWFLSPDFAEPHAQCMQMFKLWLNYNCGIKAYLSSNTCCSCGGPRVNSIKHQCQQTVCLGMAVSAGSLCEATAMAWQCTGEEWELGAGSESGVLHARLQIKWVETTASAAEAGYGRRVGCRLRSAASHARAKVQWPAHRSEFRTSEGRGACLTPNGSKECRQAGGEHDPAENAQLGRKGFIHVNSGTALVSLLRGTACLTALCSTGDIQRAQHACMGVDRALGGPGVQLSSVRCLAALAPLRYVCAGRAGPTRQRAGAGGGLVGRMSA